MHIGIDLRGLNYNVITGINNYTLKLLEHLPAHHTYTVIGLNDESRMSLQRLLPNTDSFRFVSLAQYYNSKLHHSQRISTAITLMRMRISINNDSCKEFDYLLLPQPKPIQVHPKTKLVVSMHDIYSMLNPSRVSWRQGLIENGRVYKLLTQNSYRIITNSHNTARDIYKHLSIPKKKLRILYPGAVDSKLESQPRPMKSKYFLAISGIEPRKNWLNMIRAFMKTSEKNPEIHLVLLGRPINQKYLKKVRQLAEGHRRIRLVLDADEQTKYSYLQHCYALLYPSLYEGFGFPILEAFTHSKPVITSAISSMPEVGGAGSVYVNPFDESELTAAMNLVLDDDTYYKRLQAHTKSQVNKFSWSDFAARLEEVLS